MPSIEETTSRAQAAVVQAQMKSTEVLRELERLGTVIAGSANIDPCPQRFVGIISNYRFTTGKEGQVPTHRFEVLCGNGLFIHVEAAPLDFANAMIDMNVGDITPKQMNDRLCVVERKGTTASPGMVPVQMVKGALIGGVQDRWGNFLWVGATVQYGDRQGTVIRATTLLYVDFDGEVEPVEADAVTLVL